MEEEDTELDDKTKEMMWEALTDEQRAIARLYAYFTIFNGVFTEFFGNIAEAFRTTEKDDS